MKKQFAPSLIAVSLLLATSFVYGASPEDGVYTAEAQGRNAPVKVAVTMKNGNIAAVQITDQQESPGIATPALTKLPASIVEHQTVSVDQVAGATLTSQAITKAVLDALTKAGADTKKFTKAVNKVSAANNPPKIEETEILVIGGGNGGLTAAVRAAIQGKKVILIEKRQATGGVSALNHGGFAALGTRYQKEVMGVKDDRPEYLFADMLRSGHNLNDPILCKVVSEKTGEVGDWLIDDLKSHTVQPGCSFLITQNTVKLALKETPQLGKKACLSF